MHRISISTAVLPYGYELHLAGTVCALKTNSEILGHTLRRWLTVSSHDAAGSFSMQVVVTSAQCTHSHRPHFRGLHHLVVASFGPDNLFVFDLARRSVTATIREEIAGDEAFWDRLLLPAAIGVLGAAIGVVPVHCACLSYDGEGMLIAGASGAGKSTLSVALAQRGFDHISDDWTYLSSRGDTLFAHGMGVPVKLLADAVKHFPLLANHQPRMALNDELAYELPVQDLGGKAQLCCEPKLFFFLERDSTAGCTIQPIHVEEVLAYVESSVEPLPDELGDIRQSRSAIIKRIPRLSCWKLTYGGPPQVAVLWLKGFLKRHQMEIPV